MGHQDRESGKKAPAKRRGFRKTIGRVVFTLLLMVVVAVAVAIYLARSEPAYWKEYRKYVENTPPHIIEKQAKQVSERLDALAELGTLETLGSMDPAAPATATQAAAKGANWTVNPATTGDEWEIPEVLTTIKMSAVELNAWLNKEFDAWMKYQGFVKPEAVQSPMIAIKDGDLRMAFEYKSDRFTQLFSGKFEMKIRPDGKANLKLTSFFAGRLRIPVKGIAGYFKEQAPGNESAEQAGQWLSKLDQVEFRPLMKIKDRKAHVQGYKILPKGLELTLRLEGKKRSEAELAKFRAEKAAKEKLAADKSTSPDKPVATVPTKP